MELPVLRLRTQFRRFQTCTTSYTTNFPNAEPLISEGGHWITAGTPGASMSLATNQVPEDRKSHFGGRSLDWR